MSLPRVDVRMQIKKPSQVIRLNAPEFNPANVTRMSRKGAQQRGWQHRELCGSWLASDVAGTFNIFIA
ncbi:hypothetical protein QZR14_26360 [Pseudomonas sp. rhizo66]|uniref:hypothetical protein n=1 Tax=Pseudomonas sp. rhizo66 TaxID=3059674 RepID=UPI00288F13CF|nr:hypothetical protein [Pseudomonas sp. rhizo66]MDT3314893.1 hypothetical protein [Pseudomonas sp. rhizo66]